jgi:hypothetical protein
MGNDINSRDLIVAAIPNSMQLGRETLIRSIYRSLINLGRAYAAFPENELLLIDELPTGNDVLDPMSGYGLVTLAASGIGRGSFTVEMNPPQYLWQILTKPTTVEMYCTWIDQIKKQNKHWPKEKVRVATSRGWYASEALELIQDIYKLIEDNAPAHPSQSLKIQTIALLLPFAGRFSANIPDNNPTHVKQGGLCIFQGWQEDFIKYLDATHKRLELIGLRRQEATHLITYGDAKKTDFQGKKFGAMLTSPPYPNRSDYYEMFSPENEILSLIGQPMAFPLKIDSDPLLGTISVSQTPRTNPSSNLANEFLEKMKTIRRSKNAYNQDERYYFPYLRNYFFGLETAYQNVAKVASEQFVGFIVVVNNTHRNIVVPVDKIVMEIWSSLGFKASIHREKETFHIGTKNPRARGLRARHSHYVIKVER